MSTVNTGLKKGSNSMRILVTGGAGFIGSHLCEYLLNRGDEVYVIDDLSTGSMRNIEHLESNPLFHCKIESILNQSETAKILDKCDQIYHLAASVGVKVVIEQPLKSLKNNIEGTEIILELADKKKKKVLITSSSEVYGKSDNLPFSEEDDRVYGSVYSTRWGYAFSKATDEFLSLAYYRENGLPTIITRLFNTVGNRQTGSYGMVIPRLVQQALNNEPITIFGDGEQIRCFTDVSDVIKGMVTLMSSDDAIGQVFNIGSHNEISILNLAKKIINMTNTNSKIIFISYEDVYGKGFEDMRKRVPDIKKIQSAISYDPKVELDQIIENVIYYIQKNIH